MSFDNALKKRYKIIKAIKGADFLTTYKKNFKKTYRNHYY